MSRVDPKGIELDATPRRKRTRPTSTGKRVTAQQRDFMWFERIQAHGPLSSSYLLAFSQYLRKSGKRAKERLTDLFNEKNTPHNGPYLCRPMQQFRTIDSRYNQLIYDLSPAALKALKDNGTFNQDASRAGPWLHSYMVSCITGSIELATLETQNVTFIGQHEILQRAQTNLRYRLSNTSPMNGNIKISDLIPDAIFGLEYMEKGRKFYRFFVVEADRGTEPATSKNLARKSYERSILQYQQYVGHGLYKKHLKLSAPLIVLNVFNDIKKLAKMKSLTAKIFGDQGCPYMLFGTIDGFAECFKPQDPQFHLLKEPWERAGLPNFDIGKR